MTTLTDVLQRLGAVPNGDNRWIARCPLHQPDEDCCGNWKLSILRGDKQPLLLFCYRCSEKNNRELNLQVQRQVAEAIGVNLYDVRAGCGEKDTAGAVRTAAVLPADPTVLDTIYTDLLEQLDLTDRHRRWLQKRGLDPDLAFAMGYRSTPADATAVARKCWEQWGLQLATIPGFYNVYGSDQVKCSLRPQAVLTPSRDCDGNLVALKMRMLDGGKVRMRSFGSGPYGGTKAVVNCHVPLGVGKQQWTHLTVTEGERKADVYFQRSGQPVIGIPGLGLAETSLPLVHKLLQSSSPRLVTVALDQDGKPQTDKARTKLTQALRDSGYCVKWAKWDGAKGIDDAVVQGLEVKIVDVEVPESVPHPRTCSTVTTATKLTDRDIIPYVQAKGKVHRCDLPLRHSNQDYLISNLIRQGRLRIVGRDHRGQVLEAASGG